MRTEFAKYEGAGNDFILIDNRGEGFTPDPRLIARLCDRHFGIGADGVMTLSRSAGTDCAMRYFNADGSEGEMCGNGARCFALFAEHLGIGGEGKRFTAADGLHTARILRTEGAGGLVELGMTEVAEIRRGDGWWFLNTGVPHYVEFVGDLDTADVCGRGRAIRRDTARFPQGTNVNFVRILHDGAIAVRTYERASRPRRWPAARARRRRPSSRTSPASPPSSATTSRFPAGRFRYGFRGRPLRNTTRTSASRGPRGGSSPGSSGPKISETPFNRFSPMKTQKGVREQHSDELRKARRLEPLRKSGKERHTLYNSLGDEDDEELTPYPRRESALDYLDDDQR